MRGVGRGESRTAHDDVSEVGRKTVVVLLQDQERADTVQRELESACERATREDVRVAVPPVRGAGFFTDARADIDRWWAETIPYCGEVLYVADDDPELSSWFDGVEGHFYVNADVDHELDVAAYTRVSLIAPADTVEGVVEALLTAVGVERASTNKPSGKFRRARLQMSEEVGAPLPTAAVEKDVSGSEAFFHPTESAPSNHLQEELIGVLGDALRRLEGLRPPTGAEAG